MAVRILGLDPGLAMTGYAVLEGTPGDTPRLLAIGVLRTPAGEALPRRLEQLYTQLGELLARWQPQEAAVERLFFQRNVRTALQVGQARGVILLALGQQGIPVAEYTPTTVKQTLTGYGQAPKGQIQRLLQSLLALEAPPRPDDAADALAVALCHWQHRWTQHLSPIPQEPAP